jgi:CRP-like cAMP-binding protein
MRPDSTLIFRNLDQVAWLIGDKATNALQLESGALELEVDMTTEDDAVEPYVEAASRARVVSADSALSRKMHLEEVPELLRRAFRPAALETADALELAQVAVRYRFPAKAAVLRRESRSDALWLVGKGSVSVGNRDAQGGWRQARAVGGGEWLDVASAWLGETNFEAAIASTDVVAYEFPLDAIQVICSMRPNVATLLISAVAQRLKRATQAAQELAVKDVPGRLAGWLLDAAEFDLKVVGRLVMNQSKRALASELGSSPETFSRTLARFRTLGFIAVRGYKIDVLDSEGLRSMAGRAVPPRGT